MAHCQPTHDSQPLGLEAEHGMLPMSQSGPAAQPRQGPHEA